MTSIARIRVDDDGVRLVEIVVAAENAVAVRRIRGEGRAGDFRGLMLMGIMPLVMLFVIKEISSVSLDAPPCARNSSKW